MESETLKLNATLRKYQRRGVNKMLKVFGGNVLNADDMGLGKAQTLDCKIYTPDGYTLMGDIKTGDTVCTPNNKRAKVIGVYPQGVKPVYKVTFNDGSSTKCCKEHLWSINVKEVKDRDFPGVLELSNIMILLLLDYTVTIPKTGNICFNGDYFYDELDSVDLNSEREFKKIEYIGEEECQCIMIDSEDHLYLTDYGIVTHNTIQTIESIRRQGTDCLTIVACPNFMKLDWVEATKHFLPKQKVYICYSRTPKSLKGFCGTVIINYDILSAWSKEFIKLKPRLFACDESHFLKNDTKRTRASIRIAKVSDIKILLTGTPIEKNPADLFWQLKIIRPDLFTNYRKFIKRYNSAEKVCGWWKLGKARHLAELYEILTKECMVRRKKEDVLKELPPKIRKVIPLEIDNRKEYDSAEEDIINWIKNNTKLDVKKAKKTEKLARFDKLKLISALGKVNQICDWIAEESQNQKLVVFCHHKEVLKRIEEKLNKKLYVSIKSEMDGSTRKLNENRFNNDEKVRVLLTTIRVGGTGLNLQKSCCTTVFIQLDFNSARLDQAEDRVYRFGQTASSVMAIYFIAVNTLEERIMKIIDETREVSRNAIDGQEVEENEMLEELLKYYNF